eukprot:scaffold15016_cov107-Isochrysis_galbana.AAC.4
MARRVHAASQPRRLAAWACPSRRTARRWGRTACWRSKCASRGMLKRKRCVVNKAPGGTRPTAV